jgi:hypothetical protein
MRARPKALASWSDDPASSKADNSIAGHLSTNTLRNERASRIGSERVNYRGVHVPVQEGLIPDICVIRGHFGDKCWDTACTQPVGGVEADLIGSAVCVADRGQAAPASV